MNIDERKALMEAKEKQRERMESLRNNRENSDKERKLSRFRYILADKLFDYFPIFKELMSLCSDEEMADQLDAFFKAWAESLMTYRVLEDKIITHKGFQW